MSNGMVEGDIVYYARIMPFCNLYEVCDLHIRTVSTNWFIGIDKHTKHSYLLCIKDINKHVFFNRVDALKKVKEAEKDKKIICEESEDEDYYED